MASPKSDKVKAGGFIALVAGTWQVGIAIVLLATGFPLMGVLEDAMGRSDFRDLSREVGLDGYLFSGSMGLVVGYATVILSALLISGAKALIPGILLILFALLSLFAGGGFALLAILTLIGAVMALVAGLGAGGAGGLVATAQRMAKAAQETDAEVPPERRIE